jgi:hypothetical protein
MSEQMISEPISVASSPVQLPTRAEYKRLMNIKEDQEFADRYPQGQFIIIRSDNSSYPGFALHWKWIRGDWGTFSSSFGVTDFTHRRIPRVVSIDPSLGKRSYYKTLEKTITAAEKFDLPSNLIAMFVQEYNARHEEIERKSRILERNGPRTYDIGEILLSN